MQKIKDCFRWDTDRFPERHDSDAIRMSRIHSDLVHCDSPVPTGELHSSYLFGTFLQNGLGGIEHSIQHSWSGQPRVLSLLWNMDLLWDLERRRKRHEEDVQLDRNTY